MKTMVSLALAAASLFPLTGRAASRKIADIDALCSSIRGEFVEAKPQYFSGPDPWVRLDKLPGAFADAAVATVYYEGARVRWVVLEMQGAQDAWFETINYFFDESGAVKKRERRLDQYSAQVQVREEEYFQDRKAIKTTYHHSVLNRDGETKPAGNGKENWDIFYDPDAPVYTDTADLPITFAQVEFKQLAVDRSVSGFGGLASLLKFTRPAIFPG